MDSRMRRNLTLAARQRAVLVAAHPIARQRADVNAHPSAAYYPHGVYSRQRAVVPTALMPSYAVRYGTPQAHDPSEFGGFAGFSLKKIVKNVGKAVGKAVKDTGHVAGKVITSKVGQAVIGTGLALTGVGIPLAAGIGAGAQAAGQLIKPGGNLGKAAKGAAVGGAEGLAAGVAGKALGKIGVVQTLREKIGTAAPKPTTYESDERLDALASGQIPDVSVVPSSATQPVLKALPETGADVFATADKVQQGIDAAKRAGAEVARKAVSDAIGLETEANEAQRKSNTKRGDEAAKWRRIAERLREQARKVKAAGEAAQTVAATVVPPSANPISPQGGYPVSGGEGGGGATVTVSAPSAPAEAGILSNPAVLIGAAAALYLLTSRRR